MKKAFSADTICSFSVGRRDDAQSACITQHLPGKRQQGGVVFTPLDPAVKGGCSVSQYLAELPASVDVSPSLLTRSQP